MGVKYLGSTEELRPILRCLRIRGVHGIPGGAVKCVEIGKNAGGESDSLVGI